MKFLKSFLLGHFLLLLIMSGLCASAEKTPNILLITADDLGWDSLGCMGNQLKGLSPNLDRLASEGLLIKHAYVATPICGPSRQAIYTGRFPQSTGMLGHGTQPPNWWKAKKGGTDTQSITSLLLNAGYLTGMIGKHGSDWCRFSIPPHGRNEQTGMGRDPEKYLQFSRDFFTRAKNERKPFFLSANTHDPHRYWARHSDESSGWIKNMMGGSKWKPFANGKPYPDPKTRFDPKDCPVPPSYPNEVKIKANLTSYYGSVNRMDQIAGGILDALKESGLANDTVVIFLSDHGMAWDLSKWSLYPSGVRTPLIIRWPNQIKPKRIDDHSLVSVVDIAPTIAELCGLPPIKTTDGKSFHSLLFGQNADWKRESAFSCFNYMNNDPKIDESLPTYSSGLAKQFDQYRPSRALNDKIFCYVWNGWSNGTATLPKTMLGEFHGMLDDLTENQSDSEYGDYLKTKKFIEYRAPEELYDLSKDPACRENLSHNLHYQKTLQSFRQGMKKILLNTQDHELDNYLSFLNNQ